MAAAGDGQDYNVDAQLVCSELTTASSRAQVLCLHAERNLDSNHAIEPMFNFIHFVERTAAREIVVVEGGHHETRMSRMGG